MLVIHLPTRHSTIRRPCSARRFIEQPDRSERYRILLDVMREDGLEVHDEGYVAFLQTVHERWSANPGYGPEVIPNVYLTDRMHRKPTALLGELGWYSNSTSCPIVAATWPSVHASAQSAVHAADRLSELRRSVYALCLPRAIMPIRT